MKMKTEIIQYDVVIMGAGLVGASLAAALLPANLKIAIIDKTPAPENSELNFNSRAIALSWSSVQLLKKMNVWPLLIQEKKSVIEYITGVEVSEQGHFALTRIGRDEFKLPYLGAVVNADTLNYCLNHYLEKCTQESNNNNQNESGKNPANYAVNDQIQIDQNPAVRGSKNQSQIDFFRKTEIKKLEKQDNTWQLELLNGTVIQGGLLVGADGSHSFVRNAQGVGLKKEPQQQTAVVVNVALTMDHEGIAYERFLKNGAIAMLPFGKERVKCVWIASNEEAQALKAMDDQAFLQTLHKNFGFRLGILQKLGERFSYPIQVSSAENIYGHGWVLIGNAANTLSPVAAQGFNLGLRDAYTLAEILIEERQLKTRQSMRQTIKQPTRQSTMQPDQEMSGQKTSTQETDEFYNIDTLKKYAERRRQDQARVKQFTQHLEAGGIKRRLGILACEWFSPLKHQIAQLGMGMKSGGVRESVSGSVGEAVREGASI